MSDIQADGPVTPRKVGKAPARKRSPSAKKSSGRNKAELPADPVRPTGAPDAGVPATASAAPIALIRVPLSVRWRDLDAFNHVNNSQFLSYLEEARLRWMMTLPGQGLDDDIAPVVAASHLDYRRPIAWPNEVAIELFVERLGNTSVGIGHRIIDAHDEGVLYCDGHVVLVWIDRGTGRAAALPASVREACGPR